jgi:hypothetical protein
LPEKYRRRDRRPPTHAISNARSEWPMRTKFSDVPPLRGNTLPVAAFQSRTFPWTVAGRVLPWGEKARVWTEFG